MADLDDDAFDIFDELEFDDIGAGDIKPPVRINLKRVSTGVVMKLLLLPSVVTEMGIAPGDHMKLQGADMGDDIAFKISKSSIETKVVARKNTVGARKDDKDDLGTSINFNRMSDFGAAAFSGAPADKDVRVKNGALMIVLPKGDNPVVSKKSGGKPKKLTSSINESGIVFEYYGNGKYKPTAESDAVIERMVIDEQKSMAQVSAYFGNQIPVDQIKARLNQMREFGRG